MLKRTHKQPRWHGAEDFRIICNCQRHAARERALWRRSLRAVRQVKARSVALLVGVPLALSTVELPTEAMDIHLPALQSQVLVAPNPAPLQPIESGVPSEEQPTVGFPSLITPAVREQFLEPAQQARAFSAELAKEHFFRIHVPYGSIIYREAMRNNLPPELVAAVVEAESDFRARLISHKNAQGLMQIIPSTGRLMGAQDLFNPAQNIAAGTKYLRYLFNRFGDQRMVLAAYNAGEGNVEKFGGIPPFPETQNYLKKVSVRTQLYRQRVRATMVSHSRMRAALRADR